MPRSKIVTSRETKKSDKKTELGEVTGGLDLELQH